MSPVPGVSDQDWNFIFKQLGRILEPNSHVFIFGSRFRGNQRRYSDLDLAIDQGVPIKSDQLNALEECFSESDLTYKIDLTDMQKIEKDFQKHIRENSVDFPLDEIEGK